MYRSLSPFTFSEPKTLFYHVLGLGACACVPCRRLTFVSLLASPLMLLRILPVSFDIHADMGFCFALVGSLLEKSDGSSGDLASSGFAVSDKSVVRSDVWLFGFSIWPVLFLGSFGFHCSCVGGLACPSFWCVRGSLLVGLVVRWIWCVCFRGMVVSSWVGV